MTEQAGEYGKELTAHQGGPPAMQNELSVAEVMLQVRKIQEIMSQAMKKGAEIEQALMLVGLRLERDSQVEGPVDTGAL